MDNVVKHMNTTEFAGVVGMMFDFLSEQTEPITLSKLRGSFYSLCSGQDNFQLCMGTLVRLGVAQRATLTIRDIVEEVIATPKIMHEFSREINK